MARVTGSLKFFKGGTGPGTGYGFITPDGGGKDVFVHISDLEKAHCANPPENQRFEFDIVDEPKGLRARDIATI